MFKRNIETLMVPPKKIKSKINQKIVKVTSKSIGILIFITIIINVPRRFIMANWNIKKKNGENVKFDDNSVRSSTEYRDADNRRNNPNFS